MRLLEDIEELEGAEIAAETGDDLARFGLAKPDVRITLADAQGKEIGAVRRLEARQEALRRARRRRPIFEVRDYMYARLDKKPQDFVEPTTTTTAPREVQADRSPHRTTRAS
jgi:hypothetical protein